MVRLARIQNDFQRFLLEGAPEVEQHVRGSERVPASVRLGIYANAYRQRLIEGLEANYPALAKLLGGDDFAALGAAYIEAFPSRFYSIRHYGDALPDFLSSRAEYAAMPLLAELARWEWAMTEVFDAADAVPIGAETLSAIPPQDWVSLRFVWHPSVELITLYWNAPQIWKALVADSERPAASVQDPPTVWLLWRHELQIRFRSLTADEAAGLEAMWAGRSFGELCTLLADHLGEEQAPARAAAYLREWVESGLITGIRSAASGRQSTVL